ncbi:hypothetical protein T440DRAFT_535770 [Plenodomus tracheiphilus IPT5]|uniref:EamA domain-containing protein n=1 Tax=Plenodomus tracheiphilus IPT5 TaxID=1408161 RepID=A0A6A7BMB5_9PLEO|nr:hypothetical protein T440DRAFT_535770 [Plenodomus tracheiphilus IPT5]
MSLPTTKSAWLMLAITSGACAAFNGVFAKLTTTELTTTWSSSIALAFGLSASNKVVEYAIRGLFFGCNLLFNAIMWGLFTRALTLASSTVRVSIINTSANFIVTAVLSFIIFSESLPGLWWLGAAMLVTGSVIIGMREETEKKTVLATTGEAPLLGGNGTEGEGAFRDEDEDEADERVELRSVKNTDDDSSDDDGVLK